MLLSVLCWILACFAFNVLFKRQKVCIYVKIHVTAVADAVPLARGVRYLNRFSEYENYKVSYPIKFGIWHQWLQGGSIFSITKASEPPFPQQFFYSVHSQPALVWLGPYSYLQGVSWLGGTSLAVINRKPPTINYILVVRGDRLEVM